MFLYAAAPDLRTAPFAYEDECDNGEGRAPRLEEARIRGWRPLQPASLGQ